MELDIDPNDRPIATWTLDDEDPDTYPEELDIYGPEDMDVSANVHATFITDRIQRMWG